MSVNRKDESGDRALGLQQRICRRDFLNATLLASGGALLNSLTPAQLLAEKAQPPAQKQTWGGYTGEGDYRDSNGNTEEVVRAAHAVRDGAFDTLPADTIDTGEVFDCVVVGGGISGLAAALYFQDQAVGSRRTCLVLENHPIFGGEAKRNEFIVDGHRLLGPQGSNQWIAPLSGSTIDKLYERIGFDWNAFKYQTWNSSLPELPLSQTSYQHFYLMPSTFGFYFGAKLGQQPGLWVTDPWGKNLEGTPFSGSVRAELLKWRRTSGAGSKFGEVKGEPPFYYWGDEKSRHLDSITVEDQMVQQFGISRETIRMFMATFYAQGFGVGPDALSAFAGYAFLPPTSTRGPESWQSWPDGNAGIARHIVKTLIPDSIQGPLTLQGVSLGRVNFGALDRPASPVRVRINSTVVRVEHDTDPERSKYVWVTYARGGKTYRLKALSVVTAGGCWITPHIVRDLPSTHHEAFGEFHRSACLVANVAVRNWKFLYKLGITGGRWFGGLGDWTEVRKVATFATDQKTIGPDSPTVLTLYIPLYSPGLPLKNQGQKGRTELLSTPFLDYERRIREQFTEMFSRSGFDARRDIAGIVLNRWGHAFVNPQPGFFFGKDGKPAPRDVLRNKPFGRIAFANTDLSGVMDHLNAIAEAHRAVYQIWGAVS
jgi:spermidine dehydrogenase